MKKLIVAVSATLLLSACGDSHHTVSSVVIDAAQEKCKSNNGIESIYDGEVVNELKSCGMKCVTTTGRTIHRGTLKCNNGARFTIELFTGEAR